MKEYYISFGQIHRHKVNGYFLDANCLALIRADSHVEARDKAFHYFGSLFFTSYETLEKLNLAYFPRGIIDFEKPLEPDPITVKIRRIEFDILKNKEPT
jgi:hypothetical protein